MTEVILDIETDDLNATKVYCIVAKDISSGKIYSWKESGCYNEFPNFAKTVTKFIMHNGISFDAPTLNRLVGTKIRLSQVEDTLLLSQMENPVRDNGHSLASFGLEFGYPKLPSPSFDSFSEEMLTYCIRDVEITHRLYIHLKSFLSKIPRFPIDLEYKIKTIIDKQVRNGFTLDVQKASLLSCKLKDRADEIEKDLINRYEPIVEERFSEKTGKKLKDKVTVFNPASRQQIADRLEKQGWKPSKFTENGHPIVDETTLMESDIPDAKLIAEYLLLQKRVAQIKSWLTLVDGDNKVHGEVLTLRTISGRMAHTSPNMAQVPAVYSMYGRECRECWTVSSTNNCLVGCDASSLELRALAHYLDDPKFTKEVVEGDIHTANQMAAGLETRDQAKTFIYAFIYGAGAEKIGKIVGGGSKEGTKLIQQFLSNVPSLAVFREKISNLSASGYLIGLDGRRLVVRSQHAAVNLLIQGAGAVICKQWLVEINNLLTSKKVSAKLVASIHDEYQFECNTAVAEILGGITKDAMRLTQERLKVRCQLDSNYKIGRNWAETH
jgi:DNA polymerase-1